MHRVRVLELGAEADRGVDLDERRLVGHGLGRLDGLLDGGVVVVAVLDDLHVPAVGLVALLHVLGERDVGAAVDGDLVIVVQHDELAEAQVAGQRRGLRGHALLQAAVAADDVRVVVHDVEAVLVELGGQVLLGNGQPHGVRDALAQRARGHLDAGRAEVLRVAGRLGAPLAELLELVDGQVVARQVQHAVLQRAGVAVGQHEAVAVAPLGVLGVELHRLAEEHVGHGRAAMGAPGGPTCRRWAGRPTACGWC